MKSTVATGILMAVMTASVSAQTVFDKYFEDNTLRIDYYHTGDAGEEMITIDQLYAYGIWAGSRIHLIDSFNNGKYYVQVLDSLDQTVLFSQGFDSYFGEYQTSQEAAEGIKRTYQESALIPMPKQKVLFQLLKRDNRNELKRFFRTVIDPNDLRIIRDKLIDPDLVVINSHKKGDPHGCLDIVILGEGYTRAETDKFSADLFFFSRRLLKHPPYDRYLEHINIYGILKPSQESGIDEPRAGIFKNTTYDFTFNALGSERYVMTENNRALRDLAGPLNGLQSTER